MLTPGKHCEMLAANARDRATAMADWFKLFVQIYSAIVAGSLVLRLQPENKVSAELIILSDLLVVLVAVATAGMMFDSWRAWRGHREKLTEVAGADATGLPIIDPPDLRRSKRTLEIMVLGMVVAVAGFVFFNPLRN